MNDEIFAHLGPAWINNLRCEIEEKTAQPEDVELMMEYFCHLFELDEGIPPKILHQLLLLMNQAFKEYIDRKAN